MEKWRKIAGWDGYKVSDRGRIIGPKGDIKKCRLNEKGYERVRLYKNGLWKDPFVHRLVALAFIPNPKNLPQINHKDTVKRNNNKTNLEWCTNKQNAHHAIANGIFRPNFYGEEHPHSTLTNEQAFEIKNAVLTKDFKRKQLCEMYNVSEHVVKDIRYGRSYRLV